MKLAIGFINYNDASSKYLEYFLPSLKKALYFADVNDSLILAFNNSFKDKGKRSDNNLNNEIIEGFKGKENDLNIEIIEYGENLGFSKAYNIMIGKAILNNYDYFLVINPDIYLSESSIFEMLKEIKDTDLASVLPKLLVWDFKNKKYTKTIDSLGLALKSSLKFIDLMQGKRDRDNFELEKYTNNQLIGPSGAAALFKLSVLEKIAIIKDDKKQYFDERFFMYKEDCDLAYRLFLNGYKTKNCLNACMYHDRSIGDFSDGIWTKIRNRKSNTKSSRSYSFRNQHLLFIKYFKKQRNSEKFIIFVKIILLFIFALIFEQFLLKEYKNIIKLSLYS